MKNKLVRLIGIAACLITVVTFAAVAAITAGGETSALLKAQTLADGITDYKMRQSGAADLQELIDGALTDNAGTVSEWYVLALSQSGKYDFSRYNKSLLKYLSENRVTSVVSRQKYALALIAGGSTDGYIASVLDDSIGQQGIMSWIYGLHLLNNGYKSKTADIDSATEKILSLQLSDGGWAVMGNSGDTDVTAMALQALAPHVNKSERVNASVGRGLDFLSSRQLSDGGFSSYGQANPESAAQVITALSSLGIDCETDGRFIKNGLTVLNALESYCLPDGSFCHKYGDAYSESATSQALYSLVAYIRMSNGQTGLYILDGKNPAGLETESAAFGETGQAENSTGDRTESGNTEHETAEPENGAFNVTDISSQTEYNTANNSSSNLAANGGEQNPAVALGAEKPAGYKPWACLAVLISAVAVSALLFAFKKLNRKNLIAVAGIAAVLTALIILTDFQSGDSYYNGETKAKENAVGTVTLSIRCDTIIGKDDADYIPKDGNILEAEFAVEEGDTVYDILIEAAKKYGIQVDNSGAEGMAYIAGINYIYELQYGDLSGWMYFVNGESVSVGCDRCEVSDKDKIEWKYTCDMGNDLANS